MTIQPNHRKFTSLHAPASLPRALERSLAARQRWLERVSMRTLYDATPDRFARMSMEAAGILLDYSKHRLDADTMSDLLALARARGIEDLRDGMFAGAIVNGTERRAALHVALRAGSRADATEAAEAAAATARAALERAQALAAGVRRGVIVGATGGRIRDVVNIGIGGSHLGPAMVCQALRQFRDGPCVHFISSVDGEPLQYLLSLLDPHTTLFVVSSKTFTTRETRLNAEAARAWLTGHLGPDAVAAHFVAVTANPQNASAFGIPSARILPMWDWVGGRYSLWSAIGLPIMMAVGGDRFSELLGGARAMDAHFRNAPLACNMPVILGLLAVWYRNFWACGSHAILPYEQRLSLLPDYLRQLEMESNGKQSTVGGHTVGYETCPVIWGASGNDGQHAFFQLLHQGTSMVPCDFLASATAMGGDDDSQRELLANCLAQSEALMRGRTREEVMADLRAAGYSHDEVLRLAPHKIMPGNRPSSTLLFARLNPATLGALLALYEHKTFVQAAIWDINPFDQWGVELGKSLALDMRRAIDTADDGTAARVDRGGLLDAVRRYREAV